MNNQDTSGMRHEDPRNGPERTAELSTTNSGGSSQLYCRNSHISRLLLIVEKDQNDAE